ncbi:hypothetical protein [Streptococcus thermophilus]|uniref:hypothetical protein n=1 Tax=Streptococcus thermophilus TaxID=1308 RepID=UPI0032192084
MGDEFITMVDERIRHDKEKKSISFSNKEKDRRSDCQSIEEPKASALIGEW